MQNIFRTLKAGSAASLLRNSDFSAPDVKFLGVLPTDIKEVEPPRLRGERTRRAGGALAEKSGRRARQRSVLQGQAQQGLLGNFCTGSSRTSAAANSKYFSSRRAIRNAGEDIVEKIKKGDYVEARHFPKGDQMKKIGSVSFSARSSPPAWPGAGLPNTYQVTGAVLAVADDTVTVEKGKEKWEIARTADTRWKAATRSRSATRSPSPIG